MRLGHSEMLLTGLFLAASQVQAQPAHKCTPLTFAADGTASIYEHIPDFIPLCYSFKAQAGQTASVDITRDDQMKFTIVYDRPGDNLELAVADQEQSYHFTTDAKNYRILLSSSLIHANTSAYFKLNVKLR